MSRYPQLISLFCCGLSAITGLGQDQIPRWSQEAPTSTPSRSKLTDLYGDPLPRGAAVRYGTRRLRSGEGASGTLSFSLDGSRILATGVENNTIGIWSVDTGTEVLHLCIPQAHCLCAAFSPDGKLVAIGTAKHSVYIWDPRTGKVLHQL